MQCCTLGLDLSRRRLDFHLLNEAGDTLEVGAAPPDVDGLGRLVERVGRHDQPVAAAIEAMTGARFVHDLLERAGWQVEIADARKVKGLAPLACKTDRIDAWVLAELSRRELVPAIWLPDPAVRAERERARFRLYLVRRRAALKQRIHQTLVSFGHPCPVSDLFGVAGRKLLDRLALPEPWQGTLTASLRLIDGFEREIDACERELRQLAAGHPYVPLLMSCPGIAWVLALHDRGRDRRHRPLRLPKQVEWLHGTVPARLPVGRQRPSRPALEGWAEVPALGADRGLDARLAPPCLPRAARAHPRPPRQAARPARRTGRHRPQARARDLAHVEPPSTLRSGRRRVSSGRMTVLV